MSWPWDRAFVINLVKRPDRLLAFRRQANALDLEARAMRGHYDRLRPQTGCMASHASLLQMAAELDGATAIFEDDALFAPHFREKLGEFVTRVPDDWEVLWLGGRHRNVARPITRGVVAPYRAHRSQAYIVRTGEVASALAENARSHLQDGSHFDHVTAELLAVRGRVYCPDPWLVGQSAGKSDITGGVARERWS